MPINPRDFQTLGRSLGFLSGKLLAAHRHQQGTDKGTRAR